VSLRAPALPKLVLRDLLAALLDDGRHGGPLVELEDGIARERAAGSEIPTMRRTRPAKGRKIGAHRAPCQPRAGVRSIVGVRSMGCVRLMGGGRAAYIDVATGL
jgi:hypothetical protein